MADRIVKPDTGNDLVLQNDDASAKIEINEDGSIPVTGTFDVSSATLTTSSAQKTAIVDGGKGNLTKSDVGLSNVTNDAQVPASGGTFSGNLDVASATGGVLTLKSTETSIIAADEKFGQIQFYSSDTSAGSTGVFAKIDSASNRIFDGDNASGMNLRFFTGDKGDGAGSPPERMRIDSSGNVGIGTPSPNRQLNVENTIANLGGVIGLTSSDSSTSGTCGIIHFGNSTDSSIASINGIADGANDAGALLFKTEATGGAIEERMRIDSSGNLKFNSGFGSVGTAYGCRAWVNFRGTTQSGTATASGLVSGQYTATVTSATQFTVVYSSTTYTINTSGNHAIAGGVVGKSEGVDLTVSGTTVTIDTQIRASGNVSSITDNGVGNYTVNFTTQMPDINFSTVGSTIGTQHASFATFVCGQNAPNTTSTVKVQVRNHSGTQYDHDVVNVAVFR